MTVTRTPLCAAKYCPAPSDPDWHHCLVTGSNVIEHHHVEGRGKTRTMDKKKVVPLAPQIHKNISLNEYGDAILDLDGSKTYRIWNLKNETIHEGVHWWMQPKGRRLSDGAEGRAVPPEVSAPSALSLSPKEESDGRPNRQTAEVLTMQEAPEDNDVLGGHESRDLPPVRERTRSSVRPERPRRVSERRTQGGGDSHLTHEQRVEIAQEIKDAQQRRQFLAGDTANAWEEELNEDFWNLYANEFGYTYPSLRNAMRLCRRIPPNQRHDEMSFAHHEAVKAFDIETREAWLERAFEEEWPVKRLREELVLEGLLTAKPKTRKWTLEQLREAAIDWGTNGPTQEFLEWLQQRS